MGSLALTAYSAIPLDPEAPGWGRQVAETANNMLIGKLNNTGTVTLGNGVVSTTVSDARCGPATVVLLMATSPLGAVALNQWSVQTRTNGAFTITHISTSTATATAAYCLLG